MPKMDSIIKQIKELPPLPTIIQKLLQVVGDESSSAKDLTRVLASDQALTGKVLKLVNSSFYGFSGKISTLTRAVVILGYSAIRNLALGFSAYDALKKIKGPLDWDEYWNHALTTAAGAQLLASEINYPEPEEAFINGLLHDLGYFVLNMADPEAYKRLAEVKNGGVLEYERDTFGMSHCEAGIRVMEHWKLPESMCRVARFHHTFNKMSNEEETLLQIVTLADILSCVKGSGYVERGQVDFIAEITEVLNISMNEYGRILLDMDNKIEEAKSFLNIAEDTKIYDRREEHDKELITIVVVSANESRRMWADSLLRSFGFHVVTTSALSPKSQEHEQVHFVMLDMEGLEKASISKLAICITGMGIPVSLLCDKADDPFDDESLNKYVRIPFVFTKENIVEAIKGGVK